MNELASIFVLWVLWVGFFACVAAAMQTRDWFMAVIFGCFWFVVSGGLGAAIYQRVFS